MWRDKVVIYAGKAWDLSRGWVLWILYKINRRLVRKVDRERYEKRIETWSEECKERGYCEYCSCSTPQMFFVKECIALCRKRSL